MRKEILNFINLFSDDKKVLYNALIEKKDLILDKYYIELDFKALIKDNKKIYPKIFAILDGGIYFDDCFLDNEKDNMLVSLTSHLNLYKKEAIPFKKGCFYVGLNFNKINDKVYKELFPNIYPKIFEDELIDFNDELMNAYAKLMIGYNNEYILLLPKNVLFNNVYPLDIAYDIIYRRQDLNKKQVDAIKEIAQKKNLIVEVI